MKSYFVLVYLFAAFIFAEDLQPYISGGGFVKYDKYPHSVFIIIRCQYTSACGGSILNQNIILTAAHCTDLCEKERNKLIQVKYGHEEIDKMNTVVVKAYVSHERYNEESVVNDISMMMTKERIKLNNVIKRVIIMQYPPPVTVGYVAGWGVDETDSMRNKLKHTSANIQTQAVCAMGFGKMKPGIFCAGPVTGLGAAKRGDSGGALVTRGYIQIGIVSYRIETYSLVAYTNVSYYYDWIMKNSRRLFCVK